MRKCTLLRCGAPATCVVLLRMHVAGEPPTEENMVEAPLSDVMLCDECATLYSGKARVGWLVPEAVFKMIDDGMAAKGHRPLDRTSAEIRTRPIIQ